MSVQVRYRESKSGNKNYYLDIHHKGERWREFLKIKIESRDPSKIEKKRIIEKIRINRELELLSNETGYIPVHLKTLNFFIFADDFLKHYRKRDVRMIDSSIKQFKKFVDNPKLNISQITPSFMEKFKEYLIYDAYNEMESSGGDNIDFWDMGLIRVWDKASNNWGDGQIFKVFSSLPEGISVGNPSLSKNSPLFH